MKLHKKKVQNTLKVAKNEDWLVAYAIYMSMKMDHMNKKWQDWPKDEKIDNRLFFQNTEKRVKTGDCR